MGHRNDSDIYIGEMKDISADESNSNIYMSDSEITFSDSDRFVDIQV
jgi:hypothetical protein